MWRNLEIKPHFHFLGTEIRDRVVVACICHTSQITCIVSTIYTLP